jgi:chromate reductase
MVPIAGLKQRVAWRRDTVVLPTAVPALIIGAKHRLVSEWSDRKGVAHQGNAHLPSRWFEIASNSISFIWDKNTTQMMASRMEPSSCTNLNKWNMPTISVAVIVGSLRKDSINLKLARAVEGLAAAELKFDYIQIGNLPLYTQEFDANYPPVCQQLKKEIQAADALLFVTPEYNRSIPGVLKNAIDIASRPYGTNAFAGKPGAVIGASIGAPGAAMAQQHLRNVLAYLDVPTLGQPEVFIHFTDGMFDSEGRIENAGTRKFLQSFVDRYVAWVKRFRS